MKGKGIAGNRFELIGGESIFDDFAGFPVELTIDNATNSFAAFSTEVKADQGF
jgi:hypothetical protein